MPELLSPVGNMECLMAAINGGCDAVYLAGKAFGARGFAGNFNKEELVEAIHICHLYDVKLYVTVNTLIFDNEVDSLLKYIDFLHSSGVDAVIMQDIGMIDLVRKTYPNLEIHASTQANIHNLEGVKFCEELGIKRVVLARETPFELIKEIKENTNCELEIFVHGALCMSYSGECLMSALIGNRSGNRGTCAQCCRQPYSLEINNKEVDSGYLLSTKDLNTLINIGKLIDCGVSSLKIEGRMKRPEYVYLVTSMYRRAIDNYKKYGETRISKTDILELKKMFNREFTKGFIFGESNDNFVNTFRPNHLGVEIGKVVDYKNGYVYIKLEDELNINDGIRIIGEEDNGCIVTSIFMNNDRVKYGMPWDVVKVPYKEKVSIGSKVLKTTDNYQIKDIEEKIKINKKISINGKCILKIGYPIKLVLTCGKYSVECESDYVVEPAMKSETTKDRINEQLNKLGDTVYTFSKLDLICDNGIFVPINKLNELRRNAIELLNEKRLEKKEYIKSSYSIEVPNFEKCFKNSLLISCEKDCSSDLVYIDDEEEYSKISSNNCILKLPRINEHLKDYSCRLLVSDLGSVYKYRNNNIDTDFSLNVTNSYSVAFLHSVGVNKVTLSCELDYKQICNLVKEYENRYGKHPNVEVIVSGNIEAMVCKYNILNKYDKKYGRLVDRFGNKYYVKYKDNLMYIYDYNRKRMSEPFDDSGVNYIRVNNEKISD